MRRYVSFAPFVVLAITEVACGSRASARSEPIVTQRTALEDDGPADEWPTFGHDRTRSFASPSSHLTPESVSRLTSAWTFSTGDAVTAQVAVSGGTAYFGSWDGYFYAVNRHTGALRWKFALDCQNAIVPSPARCLTPAQQQQQAQQRATTDGGIVTSTAAVVDGVVYFGGGRTLYALDARTGSLKWKHVICGNPDDPSCLADANDGVRIFSSPAVASGLVFVGTSADGQVGYRGGFHAIDAATGALRWRFEIDPLLDASGNVVLGPEGLPVGGYNRGCGNTFSSATFDEEHELVLFGTSDCNALAPLPYNDAVLALEARSGRLRWALAPHAHDDSACDVDFGATANLSQGHVAAIGGKDGTFYLIDPGTGRALASTNVVFGGSAGGFFGGAAALAGRYYSATGFGDFTACAPGNPRDTFLQEPSLHAFDGRTDAALWEQQGAQSVAATVAGNGVLFVTHNDILQGTTTLEAFSASIGALVWSTPLSASDGPATVLDRMLLEPTGNVADGTGGGVTAFALPD